MFNRVTRQLFTTYVSLIIMVIQSFSAAVAPYRVYSLLNATAPAIIASPFLFPAVTLGVTSTFFSPPAKAIVKAPVHTCPTDYEQVSGRCMKREEAPINITCPSGYQAKLVYETVLGKPVNTCVATRTKNAEPLCASNQTAGGINNQQCRTEIAPYGNGLCPSGLSRNGAMCVGAWSFPNAYNFVCSDLCNVALSSPTATCPADDDPIELAKEENQGVCTAQGQAEGKCTEGETVYFQFPSLDWSIESPLINPSASNPIQCYRTEYEPQERDCPSPNTSTGSVYGDPRWGTPSGSEAGNPAFYDPLTREPTTCTRTWIENYTTTCAADYVYDLGLNGCISEASTNCPTGTTFSNGQCLGGDGKQCPESKEYDELSSMCVTKMTDSSSFMQQYNSGADLGWAIGGLQQTKKQSANRNGDITLDMGLLNQDADAALQAYSPEISSVTAIGENDRTHNTYSGIENTYGDEKNQTTVIRANHQSYKAYEADADPEHVNLAAEAYLTVSDSVKKNRPPGLSPDSDWLQGSQNIFEQLGLGTDPYFGDCDVAGTKQVLNLDRQIITEESCTKPVLNNFNSCQVQRYMEQPTLKILEGADKAEVEIIAEDTIRLTIGEKCNNCLNDGGQACKTFTSNVIIQMMVDINVESAKFVSAVYDDMIVINADGNEAFRAAKAPWNVSGWPSPGQSCENGTSYTWSGAKDVTEAFKTALEDDNKIDFNYKIGVGGLGEAYAVVEIKFDRPIRTDWFDEPIYTPEGCGDRFEASECSATNWQCDIAMKPQTLGMDNWIQWDGVANWNITNGGYDAKSTLNGPFSAYGSPSNVGDLWFKGKVTVQDSDDDSFGFMIGYPQNPNFNKDPKSSNYNPNAVDTESNHFFVLAWTGNTGSNAPNQGLGLYKSYVDHETLERRDSNHWGLNFHADKFEIDPYGNSVKIVENIYSNRSLVWRSNVPYDIEYKQDEFGYLSFSINNVKHIDLSPEDVDIKTGRFGFMTTSLKGVFFQGMEKVTEYSFGSLFPGDSDPSTCVKGHAVDYRCGTLANGGALLGPNASVWSYDDIKNSGDTCGVLADNPDCSWVSRGCAEGFEQPDGSCVMEREVYQCVDNTNAWETVPTESTCAVLPCSGGDCELRGKESNSDFADVVTQIAVISEMSDKMECSDPKDISTCQIFSGKQRTCSYDQLGMIDCCEEFEGKTVDLFSLALNIMVVASFESEMLGVDESMASQAWGGMTGYLPDMEFDTTAFDGIGQSITDTGDAIKADMTSAWESVGFGQSEKVNTAQSSISGTETSDTGVTDKDGEVSELGMFTDMVVDAVKDFVVDEVIAMAMDQLVSMLPGLIQQAIVSVGVSLGAEIGTEVAMEAAAQEVMSQGIAMMANVMSGIGMAIAIIQIADMLYQMLNGCDEEEQDMPQVLKEKKCYYAYTKKCKKTLGVCQSKNRKRHCCFSSVMSRIIMEQAITQPDPFGGNTFSKKDWYDGQKCRGLTLLEVPLLDFDKINLDEWYDLMVQSETLPDADETLESFTKDKSFSNPYARKDALQVQKDRGIESMNKDLREVMDGTDILGIVDCSATPDIQGCQTNILGE